ncbi:thiol reductant ABC exporter subunit CydC [Glaciihabitans arcticus]|uniref:Thiol reductant ABC exporter subunit CydC n=1 Tax=Glaciihabitans arcticus TaxID=2668039 RepID=A0A4Q9GYC8_9MICO|nr:thiol reductant ABC exporter subunit CydC [Glaciihabitans arcticus]TBN58247.1 thiol reductant ABC exporter subunit CydC [Glaciihabitans arcticus]
MKRLDASPLTLGVLGLFSALRALGLVAVAEAVATGVVGVIAGEDVGGAIRLAILGGALRAAASWASQVYATRAALAAKSALRLQLTDRALAGPSGSVGSLTAIGTVGLDELDNYYRTVLPSIMSAAVVPLLVGVRILSADWVSAIIVVLTVPLVPVFLALVGMHTRDRADAASSTLSRLSDHLVELARGLPVLVGLGRVADQTAALERISTEHRRTTMSTLKSAFLSSLVLELISTISVAIVAVAVGVRLVHGDMPLALGLVALVLAPECFAPFRDLGAAFHSSQDGLAAQRRARAMIDAPLLVSPVRDGDFLRVDGLTVRYPDRGDSAVTNVSFEVRAGGVTSLEGASGSGKTTVLRVLAGELTSFDGRVVGIDPSLVAWVPQHPHTVGETVRAELALYGSEVDRVLAQLGLSHLADVDPARLSPGELRRVAVARGLLRVDEGARLLLLDEPTAHLDAASAALVENALRMLRGRVTMVIASHEAAVAGLADTRVLLGSTTLRASDPIESVPMIELAPWSYDDRASDRATPAPTEPAKEGVIALLAYLRPTGWRFTASILLGAAAALFAISLTAVSGWLIVRASEQPPIMYLLVAIVGVRFFGLGRSVLRYAERLLTHDAVLGSLTDLRMRLWTGLAARGVASRGLARGGVALDYLVASADRVRDLVPRVLLPIAVGVLCAIAVVIAVLALHAPALPVLLVLLAVCLVVSPAIALLADRSAARGQALIRSSVVRRFAATLAAAGELRANGVSARARDALASLDSAAAVQARRTSGALGLGGALTLLACCAATGAMLAVTSGVAIQPGIVAVLALLPIALAEPMLALIDAVQQAPALRSALRRVAAVTELPAPVSTGTAPVDRITRLELSDLSAGWDGAEPAFRTLHAEATPGDWVIVDGPSGSGKSTLLATVLGYLAPASGSLLINGEDARGLDPLALRARMAWCPQEGHLFDSTIRANLLLARARSDRPSDATLLESLDRVGLGPLIASLPLGLDTRIGAEGTSLSGGQRQRLAVARTLLTRADVVLLDEPTAHLDAGAAAALMSDLRSALAGRIVVMVTHHAADTLDSDVRVHLGRQTSLRSR